MKPWKTEKLAVIDFETTGINPLVDRVVECGIVHFENGSITACHNKLINPTVPIPSMVSAINNITNTMVKDCPTFADLKDWVLNQCKDRIMVSYNVPFDQPFLIQEFARAGVKVTIKNPWIDPLVWVRHLYKYEKSKKLTSICRKLAIPLDGAHRAENDAAATGKVLFAIADHLPDDYDKLIEQQQALSKQHQRDFAKWKEKQNVKNKDHQV